MRAKKTGAAGDDGNRLRLVGMCGHRAPYLTAGTLICEQKEGEIQFRRHTQSYGCEFEGYALDFHDDLGFNLN
jgi:hypothetical protein